MLQENFTQLLQFFKVLGNESRLQILGLLANQERSVGELAEILDLREPTISHHLALMKKLGLVGVRAEGTVRVYWLDTKLLEQMSKDIFSQDSLANLVDSKAENPWEQKVLQTYIQDNKIKQIPSRHKKQLVLLKWLVDQFEMGVRYSEAEMNERINQYHPDHATLRRSLIDSGLMQREKGIYWRVEKDQFSSNPSQSEGS